MNTKLYIPTKCKAGFQERSDTYTKKLGYVIYFDNKIWRKEPSWEGWRDKKIDVLEFDNIPTEGFVLNKKVGGTRYDWNVRDTKCRVFDPRGFEIEIDIPNLLYILENTSSIKGKGLEGNFIYAWDGKDLVLIPENAPEYKEMMNFTTIQSNKVSSKDLVVNGVYFTKKQEEYIYLGKFDKYSNVKNPNYSRYSGSQVPRSILKKTENCHWFVKKGSHDWIATKSLDFLSNFVEQSEFDISDLIDDVSHCNMFSPIDESKFTYELEILENNTYHYINGYIKINGEYKNFYQSVYPKSAIQNQEYWKEQVYEQYKDTVKVEPIVILGIQIPNDMNPIDWINKQGYYKQQKYLQNGKPLKYYTY